MATVLPFALNKFDFDDEATRMIGEAFNAACGDDLHDTGQHALVREMIANRIVEAARRASAIRFACATPD